MKVKRELRKKERRQNKDEGARMKR